MSLIRPPGDFISPDFPIEDVGPVVAGCIKEDALKAVKASNDAKVIKDAITNVRRAMLLFGRITFTVLLSKSQKRVLSQPQKLEKVPFEFRRVDQNYILLPSYGTNSSMG